METVWSCGGHGPPKWLLENKTGSCSGPSFWEWAGKEGSLELEPLWWAFCLMRTFCLFSGLFACIVGYMPVWWAIRLYGGLFACVVGYLPVWWAISLCGGLFACVLGYLSWNLNFLPIFYCYVIALYVWTLELFEIWVCSNIILIYCTKPMKIICLFKC